MASESHADMAETLSAAACFTADRASRLNKPVNLAGRDARRLGDLAPQHLRAGVALVLIGGLPGTGKSTVAGAVADSVGWELLNSDRIRKELAGIAPDADGRAVFGTGIYTPAWTARTYAELLRRAGDLLGRGESVILDASWSSAELRSAAAGLARAQHAHFVELRCVASPELARQRLQARPPGPSDARPEIAVQLAAAAAPWPTATVINTERGGADQADGAVAAGGLRRAGGKPDGSRLDFGPGFSQIVAEALAAIGQRGG
jgi:predicted kinase